MSFGHHADDAYFMRDENGWVIGEDDRFYDASSLHWHDTDGDLGPCDPLDDLDTVTVRLRCLDCGETAVFAAIRDEIREDCCMCRSLNTEVVVEPELPLGPADARDDEDHDELGWGDDPFDCDVDDDTLFAEELARQARELGWTPRRIEAA